jgi:hypothetical protein
MQILSMFAHKGGEVVWVGDVATHVGWKLSNEPTELALRTRQLPLAADDFAKHYREERVLSVRHRDGRDAGHVFAQLRQDSGVAWLMLANVDTETAAGLISVQLARQGQVQEWNPVTCQRTVVPSRRTSGITQFETSLEAGESRLFVVTESVEDTLLVQVPLWETERVYSNRTNFQITLDEPNAALLDVPRYRIDEGQWSEPQQILEIDVTLRHQLGLEQRSNTMIQPWFREMVLREETASLPSVSLALLYEFWIHAMPEKDIEMALEQAERYAIFVNGEPLDLSVSGGWWVDPSLRRFTLPRTLLRLGKNEITMESVFSHESDLEAVFLLGEFGVQVEGLRVSLGTPIKQLEIGDWTKQGLPFYGGCVRYEIPFEAREAASSAATRLVVPQFEGICARVFEQANHLGTIAWRPYQLELPATVDGLTDDKVLSLRTYGIEVVGSRANANGMIHKKGQDSYSFTKMGLMEAPYLSVQQKELILQ